MKITTELQIQCHQEQMAGHRRDFMVVWTRDFEPTVKVMTAHDCAELMQLAWNTYCKKKGLR